MAVRHRDQEPWRELGVINSDAYGYNRYLMAVVSPPGMGSPITPFDGYAGTRLPNGNVAFKYTMGMAVMNAPLFLAAHVYARWTGSTTDGFSQPYQAAFALSNWLWSVLALLVTAVCSDAGSATLSARWSCSSSRLAPTRSTTPR